MIALRGIADSKDAQSKPWAHILLGACLIVGLALGHAGTPGEAQDAAARRMALLQIKGKDAGAVARLAGALRDQDPLVARTAARLLLRCGKAALPHLKQALEHDDLLVRRSVVIGLGEVAEGAETVELLAEALKAEHPLLRQAAVFSLSRVRPRSARVRELLDEAGKDENTIVSEAALHAARSSYVTVQAIRLPADGWKFRLDPERVGKDGKWFAPDLDDSGWDDIGIEKAWQGFDYDYIGVAWYRRTIDLPARPKGDAQQKIELRFEGVDECAWVWVNGQYAGEHDIGPTGWDKPFSLDVTDLLRWGGGNQITVRAMNTAMAGGIWRPVTIMILELAE